MLRYVTGASALALLLTGCGQTGPLYLPERGEVVTRPAAPSATTTPAEPAVPAVPAPEPGTPVTPPPKH
jgi:predicted small lipoprotein YifL